jgi:hypothetical protein
MADGRRIGERQVSEVLRAAFQTAMAGDSGIDSVDAWREVLATLGAT